MVNSKLDDDFETTYFRNLRDERSEAYRERSVQLLKGLEGDDANWLMSIINQRLGRQGAALETSSFIDESLRHLIEAYPLAVILVSGNNKLMFISKKAQTLLESQASLIVDDSYLKGTTPEFDKQIKQMIATVCDINKKPKKADFRIAFTLDAKEQDQPYFAAFSPIRLLGGKSAMAAMFLYNPQALPVISTQRLRAWYGLSKKEAQLTIAFAHGTALKDYADIHGISMTTVRTQFAQIKTKMNANNQATVVRLTLLAHT